MTAKLVQFPAPAGKVHSLAVPRVVPLVTHTMPQTYALAHDVVLDLSGTDAKSKLVLDAATAVQWAESIYYAALTAAQLTEE